MNNKKLKASIAALSFCISAWMMPGNVAFAATNIIMNTSQSQDVNMPGGISRIAIANPEIADVTVMSGEDVLIVAKKTGSTTLFVWNRGGTRNEYMVVVTQQDVATGEAIQHIIGYPGVTVDKIGDQILLGGRVLDQEQRQRALSIAKMYSGNVVDMLSMTHPKQIRIEARIVELSKNKSKNLGINWGNAASIDDTTGIVTVNPGSFAFGQNASSNYWTGSLGNFGTFASINATLNLLVGKGAAKVLSQPHVVTMSGEKASILIGGEMPVPTTNSNGSTNVEWKNYGIELDMEPVVNDDGLITSKIMASVSTLSEAAGLSMNGTTIKGLSSRKATTVVSLPSGQTMVIGGLLSSTDTKSVSKIPLLGDLPIIGRFFRSNNDSSDERELLIFVTPTLVDPTTPTKVSTEMKDNLHNVTKSIAEMKEIPSIYDSHTVIAQEEPGLDDDRAVSDKKKRSKNQQIRQISSLNNDLNNRALPQDPIRTIPTVNPAGQNRLAAQSVNEANNTAIPVQLDQYEDQPGILEQMLAAKRAANNNGQ